MKIEIKKDIYQEIHDLLPEPLTTDALWGEDAKKVRPYDYIWDMYYDEFEDVIQI